MSKSSDTPSPDPQYEIIQESSDEQEIEDLCLLTTADNTNNESETNTRSRSTRNTKKSRKKTASKQMHCSVCQPKRYFKKKSLLELHKQVIHSTDEPIICLWCAKYFFTQNQLQVHQKLYSHDRPLN
ncbi:gastrula zinc finger protein XlCGF62.1-like [Oppia nitens]|uniref:gastrula zinc finger protein XlCGF62.1-like n=1 Tax=Oppia nitens TaxID=1686743 RepID=UPI0023DC57FC|nr:gastrula zinc finger protein XlCGF62.1-like [Oppia nitens]